MTKHIARRGTMAARLIATALTQVGYKEGGGRTNNNNQKYSDEVPGFAWSDFQPWCDTFCAWCAWKSDIPESIFPRSASCDASGAAWKKMGRWSEFPAVGAQVLLGTPSDLNHTGIVEAWDADYIYTVEGNTNDTGSREGDGVYRKKRLRRGSNIIGYGYPKFPEGIDSADPAWGKDPNPPGPKPEPVPDPPTKTKLILWCDVHPVFQKGFDFEQAKKQGIKAVCIKIGQGGDVDYGDDFRTMWREAREAGLGRSVYYWFEHDVPLAPQIAHLLALIPSNDVPVGFDIEPYDKPGPGVDIPTPTSVTQSLAGVKRAGLRPGLGYLPRWVSEAHLPGFELPRALTLWGSAYGVNAPLAPRAAYVANARPGRWKRYAGQQLRHLQFGSRVRIGGKNADCSVFKGQLDELSEWFLMPKDSEQPNPDPPPIVHPDPLSVPARDGFWNIGAGKPDVIVRMLHYLASHTDKFSVCEAGDRDEEVAMFLAEHPDWRGYWSKGLGGAKVRCFWKTAVYSVQRARTIVAVDETKVTRTGKKGKGAGPGTIDPKVIHHVELVHIPTGRIVDEVATHLIASWTKSLAELGKFEYDARRAHGTKHVTAIVNLLDGLDPTHVLCFKADLNAPKSFTLLRRLRTRLEGWTGENTHGPREIDVILHDLDEQGVEDVRFSHPEMTPGDHKGVIKVRKITERLSA